MLSKVAGPIAVRPHDESETLVVKPDVGLWVDGLGLVVIAHSGSTRPNDLYVLQLDGSALRIGQRHRWGGIGLAHDGIGRAVHSEAVCLTNGAGLGDWRRVRLPSTAQLEQPHTGHGARASMAVLPDRVLSFSSGEIFWSPLDDWGQTSEATLADSGAGLIFPAELSGAVSRWWVADSATGLLYVYDALSKAEVPARRTSVGGAFRSIGFSRVHRLFVVLRDDGLHVYAEEPQAATISAPAFSLPPKRGASVELSARVLGDLGEPCPGRRVSFAVSVGAAAPSCVATDAQGWARTRYEAPFVAADDATATATLVE